MKVYINSNVRLIADLLIYLNLFLLIVLFFVEPTYTKGSGSSKSVMYIQMTLIIADIILLFFIGKKKILAFWLLGVSGFLMFFLINFFAKEYSSIDEILKNSHMLLIYSLDFLLLLFLSRKRENM